MSDVDPRTASEIDSVESAARASEDAEAIVAFHRTLLDGGLPPHLAEDCTRLFVVAVMAELADD